MAAPVKKFEPSRRITSFHIRGFQHWDGAIVLDELTSGKKLDIIPEPDNPYDPQAMAIYYMDVKLGYVPANENALFSLLAYYGHVDVFESRIIQIDREADPWDQVRVAVYVKDARNASFA